VTTAYEHHYPGEGGVELRGRSTAGEYVLAKEKLVKDKPAAWRTGESSASRDLVPRGVTRIPITAEPIASQNVPAAKRFPVEETRGLPEENLPMRLARKFLIGIIRQDRVAQLQAHRGLVKIAKKAARKAKLFPHHDEGMTAEHAATVVLAGFVNQKRKPEDLAYFGRVVRMLMLDDLRKRTRQKRGNGMMPSQLYDGSYSRVLADAKLPAKRTRPRGSGPDQFETSAGFRIPVSESINSEGNNNEVDE
jgi:hypothetical protein